MLDDDLLSHGEAPHYHRRCVVSLLSSGWDQVVPTLYGRQAIRLGHRFRATPNRVRDSRIRYLFAVLQAFGLSHPLCRSAQIVWVLYGQASRAISIG